MYHFFLNFQAKILTKTKIAAQTMTVGKIENVKNTMTLRHLFTMTAGLTYNVESENIKRGIAETRGIMPTREAMKYIACDPLSFEPGSSWLYSLCHDVLGAVVEVASK
jgi:CubicO group peptidase (beta-lactamase class C family)